MAWLVAAVVALTVLTATAAPAIAVARPAAGDPSASGRLPLAAATLTPAITVATSAAPGSFSGAGQTLDFSYLVTNSGDTPLTNIVVHDALAGVSPVTCTAAELVPGATTNCGATYVTTQADVDRGRVVNTAVANGTPPSGPPVTSAPAHSVTSTALSGSLSITGSADQPSFSASGTPLSFTFVVTNTGAAPLSEASILETSRPGPAATCPAQVLAPGQSMTCALQTSSTPADLDRGAIYVSAVASGRLPAGQWVTSAPTTASVPAVQKPSLQLTPLFAGSFSAAGQRVDFTYSAFNSGNVTLTGVRLVSSRSTSGPVSCAQTLPAGQRASCSVSAVSTQADVAAGFLANVAYFVGFDPAGVLVASPPSAAYTPSTGGPPVPPATGALSLAKSVAPATFTGTGQTLDYSYLVTNTGVVGLSDVDVLDGLPGLSPVTCPATTLAAGAAMTCTASYVTGDAAANAGQVNNVAIAYGSVPGAPPVVSPAAATTTPGPPPRQPSPGIALVAQVQPTTFSAVNQSLSYSYLVTNTGDVPLDVRLTEALRTTPVSCPSGPPLPPGVSMICTAQHTTDAQDLVRGSVYSLAVATGQGASGPPVTSTPFRTTATLVPATISLTKSTAQRTFTGRRCGGTRSLKGLNRCPRGTNVAASSGARGGTRESRPAGTPARQRLSRPCGSGAPPARNRGRRVGTAAFPARAPLARPAASSRRQGRRRAVSGSRSRFRAPGSQQRSTSSVH
jgi:uncharacterized repeat protein (TIGR01451 family)